MLLYFIYKVELTGSLKLFILHCDKNNGSDLSMKEKFLGEFEQMVLLAILKLKENAYGVAIRDLLIASIGREVSVGALYTTLERLEKKGLLTSAYGESSAERGGRAKKFYLLSGQGKQALSRSKQALDTLWQGIQLKQGSVYG